jgi:hypothetical protein
MAGSLTAAARELARYKLVLGAVQEVRWDEGGTVRPGDYISFYVKDLQEGGCGVWIGSIWPRVGTGDGQL